MRKTFLILLVLFIGVSISAQQKIAHVTYAVTFNTDLLFKELKAEKEAATSKESIAEDSLKAFLLEHLQPEKMIYTLTDSSITMKRQGDTTLLRTIYTYWKDSLAYKVTEMDVLGKVTSSALINMDYKKDSTWKVSYIIERKPENRKQLLGYDCYRIVLTESRAFLPNKETITRRMEMYVTDQVKLPAYIVAGLYEKVVLECPLELVDVDVITLKPKTVVRAIAVD